MGFATIRQKKNLVTVELSGSPSDRSEMDSFCAQLDTLYSYKTRFLALYDLRELGSVPLSYIYIQAQHMRENEEPTRKYMARAAIVTHAGIWGACAKFAIQTLFAIRKPAVECGVFTDIQLANTFLCEAALPELDMQKLPG